MDVAASVYGPHYKDICKYVDILLSIGVDWGLIGPREVDRIWERHILNSAALADLLPRGCRAVDVGSGAGLPGIPLAILRPDLDVTLVEPLLRRSTFLSRAVDELGLANTRVVRSRAEDHHETYDRVLARAVAPLHRLIGWCNPLRSTGGTILALKGRTAEAEVTAAHRTLTAHRLRADVLSVRAHPRADPATVVQVGPR